MKVFITKYALTEGIYERDVEQAEFSPSMVSGAGMFEVYHGEGKDWHRTKEEAIKRAEKMRVAKIKSLKQSLAKFELMRFEP